MKEIATYIQESFYKNVSDLGDRRKLANDIIAKLKTVCTAASLYTKKNFVLEFNRDDITFTIRDEALKTSRSSYILDFKDDRVWNKMKEFQSHIGEYMNWQVCIYKGDPKMQVHFTTFGNTLPTKSETFLFNIKSHELVY